MATEEGEKVCEEAVLASGNEENPAEAPASKRLETEQEADSEEVGRKIAKDSSNDDEEEEEQEEGTGENQVYTLYCCGVRK